MDNLLFYVSSAFVSLLLAWNLFASLAPPAAAGEVPALSPRTRLASRLRP